LNQPLCPLRENLVSGGKLDLLDLLVPLVQKEKLVEMDWRVRMVFRVHLAMC